jgi:beta-glucosidase
MSKTIILDWNEYIATARETVAEGCVLCENNGALPLKKGCKVAVFGRMQFHYYKSGTGSGGMVNISKMVGILDALLESDVVEINKELLEIYREWDNTHLLDEGEGWGCEPWSQEEMPVEISIVENAAKSSDTALVIIARTAGEDKDAVEKPGSYLLTDIETDMLSKVRKSFDKMVVILNVGGIFDMSLVEDYKPDAVLYAWHGGMIGGLGTVDVLTGVVSPSGHFTDTVCYKISDQPSDKYFGDAVRNYYKEDVYVGYRYFETFNKSLVRYPFGYGLSYTVFNIENYEFDYDIESRTIRYKIKVKNTGDYSGKAVVQLYMEAPQGKLGKPVRTLVGFGKTKDIKPEETDELSGVIGFDTFASYDDSGVTGHKSCFLLEQGEYKLYVGENVRDANLGFSFKLNDALILEQLHEALAPVESFERMKPVAKESGYDIEWENVPTQTISELDRVKNEIPQEIGKNDYSGIKLNDVLKGNNSIDEFIAQMSDDELACLVRGEGMGSSRVTPGTASALGGVSDNLVEKYGIPAVCCSDGPSGMRLDCGAKAFSLPNGTLLGCTFNTELVTRLYSCLGREMLSNKVECLLGPGMNIHRHLLNGRNFEYFSEDPYLTGMMAGAMIKGLKEYGVTGVAKHFCGNNQEYRRHFLDSVISERALREIYLKGYEMIVKCGLCDSIMTTYGAVNGLWTAGNYDLTTTILRKEWGFKGIVMTDWWASINERDKEPDKTNFAAMIRAQNDIYMVCPDGATNASGDNTLEALADGRLTRAELQRCAKNVCEFTMNTSAMRRMTGEADKISIINRPEEDCDVVLDDVEPMILDGDITIPLYNKESKANTNYIIPFDIKLLGHYEVTLVGSSELGELAQLPCTLFYTSFPLLTFTFHGSEGKNYEIVRETRFLRRFAVMRLFVARNGLKLKEIRFKYTGPLTDEDKIPF